MNTPSARRIVAGLALLSALYVVGYVGFWQWSVCRINVPAGHSLLLRYKGPFPFGGGVQAAEGTFVKLDSRGNPEKVGILEAMPGPGRHFYSPLEWETEVVPDLLIEPGKLGVVTSRGGKSSASTLVESPEFRGIQRKVLTPGRYRINTYAFKVEVVPVDACVDAESRKKVRPRPGDPTLIPPGYVGVVTNNIDNPATGQVRGIQDDVLQPGIYFINPVEKTVSIISIGFNETTLMVELDGSAPAREDPGRGMMGMGAGGTSGARGRGAGGGFARGSESRVEGGRLGTPGQKDPAFRAGTGIEFPSRDGFPIHMDYTAIWGILPDQAPDVVRQFGTLDDVREKVILPQIGSICRLHGSKHGAVDLLIGESREEFQTDTSEELEKVLASKNLTLLFGLTRHIYVPGAVREPIQKAKIADELKLTSDQKQLTAKAQAELTEAKARVTLEENRTRNETDKLVAQVAAEGEKKTRELEATTEKMRAEIDAKTAVVDAQITRILGEARAKSVELSNQAEADRYRQYVEALGGPEAYNRYVFAEGLPPDMKLNIIYAGPGTFWTDLKGFEQATLGKLASEAAAPRPAPAPARAR